MISIKYSQLCKFKACHCGKQRFAQGRWFKTVILDRPVTLREIIEGKNKRDDICWLANKLTQAISPAQLYAIAVEMMEILKKHGLQDADTEKSWSEHIPDPIYKYCYDMRKFVEAVKIVIRNRGCGGWRGTGAVVRNFLYYPTIALGSSHHDLCDELADVLIDFPIDIDWDHDNNGCNNYHR